MSSEEDRINRHVNRSMANAKTNNTVTPTAAPKSPGDPDLFIKLAGLPGGKGQPVEILLDGESIFKSEDENVDGTCQGSKKGFANFVTVTIKLPAVGFENEKKFNLMDGDHVTLSAGASGLEIKQKDRSFD